VESDSTGLKVKSSASGGSFLERHDFLLRRLHSFSGIIPIGLFLIAHLTTNSSVVWGMIDPRSQERAGELGHAGVASFQHDVDFINNSVPFLILIEISLWLAIGFHSVYGFYIASTGKSNVRRYDYQGNWRYTLQRISGYVGILFILYHVATLRWGWTFLVPGGTRWSAEFAASTMATILQGNGVKLAGVLVTAGYLIGITLLVFHFANGLWTAAISWGLTISEASQRRWGYACAGLGAMLMVMAWSSVFAFATLDVKRARATELRMMGESVAENVVPEVSVQRD